MYPLDMKVGGPQSHSRRYGDERNLLFLPEIEPRILGRLARSILLYRLRYPGSYQ
jgi:hypothetical protein